MIIINPIGNNIEKMLLHYEKTAISLYRLRLLVIARLYIDCKIIVSRYMLHVQDWMGR